MMEVVNRFLIYKKTQLHYLIITYDDIPYK